MDHVIEVLDKIVTPDSLLNDLLVSVAKIGAERFPDEPHLVRRVLRLVLLTLLPIFLLVNCLFSLEKRSLFMNIIYL